VGIFSTHYHADFVSGKYDLQKQHKCKIYMGPKAAAGEGLAILEDKATLKVGNITLECWHTPGHTEESSCLVVIDSKGKRDTVFTGDTVFLNEVGRPDLAIKTNLTAENLAEMLYDSLQKFKNLDDNIRIYPGHGSGSSCGKAIGAGDFCTVGNQKKSNYALKASNKSDFVKQVLADMPKPPAYFGYNANLNKMEPFFFEEASKKVYEELNLQQVYDLSQKDDVVILDVRGTEALKEGIIENSIAVGFDGGFATWVGALFNPADKFIIYGSDQQAQESITRLFRIGYINILGHSNFSMKTWKDKGYPVYVPEMVDEVIQPGCTVLDTRKPGEWKDSGVVEGATLMELTDLFNHVHLSLCSPKSWTSQKSTLSTAVLATGPGLPGATCSLMVSRRSATPTPSTPSLSLARLNWSSSD
jgi:hydroxyacylglutathione hydrolase